MRGSETLGLGNWVMAAYGSCRCGGTSQPAWVGEAGLGQRGRSFLTSLLSGPLKENHCSTHPFVNPATLTECPLETNERVPAHHY